jgi:hypothetical protein
LAKPGENLADGVGTFLGFGQILYREIELNSVLPGDRVGFLPSARWQRLLNA